LGFFALSQVLFRSHDLAQAHRVFASLFAFQMPHGMADVFAYKGPMFFILDFVVIGLWALMSARLPRLGNAGTPSFLLTCLLLILFLGRLGSAHSIYAAF